MVHAAGVGKSELLLGKENLGLDLYPNDLETLNTLSNTLCQQKYRQCDMSPSLT